jgi:GNAT superfamily N-acetyltransferase
MIFNLALRGPLAVTFFVTGVAAARDLPASIECDYRLGGSAPAAVGDRLGYLPVIVIHAAPRGGGKRIEMEAHAPTGKTVSELSIQLDSPHRAEILYSGTHASARRQGLTTYLLDRLIRDHAELRVITSTMALDNEDLIRTKFGTGSSCEDAVRQTAYAKALMRLGFTKLVAPPDCTANEIEVTLAR